jgi:hypothetical protein
MEVGKVRKTIFVHAALLLVNDDSVLVITPKFAAPKVGPLLENLLVCVLRNSLIRA